MALVFALAACGGSTMPNPPNITVVSILVSSANSQFSVGDTEQFAALATLSDTTTKPVTTIGVWSSDNLNVATVNSSTGMVSFVGIGTANIIMTYGGKTGSKAIQVL
jgi:uncharacterized protein YjdB